jgi:hypothetical protein
MMNYSIENVSPTIKKVFFESALIGEIHQSQTSDGWFVKPSWAQYTGYFKTLERATIELVFHYYNQDRQVPMA